VRVVLEKILGDEAKIIASKPNKNIDMTGDANE
jgi:hypothetical protein